MKIKVERYIGPNKYEIVCKTNAVLTGVGCNVLYVTKNGYSTHCTESIKSFIGFSTNNEDFLKIESACKENDLLYNLLERYLMEWYTYPEKIVILTEKENNTSAIVAFTPTGINKVKSIDGDWIKPKNYTKNKKVIKTSYYIETQGLI